MENDEVHESTHHILQPTPALKDLTCRVSIFRQWIITFTPIPPSHPGTGIHHIPPASPLYSPAFLKYSIPFPCCLAPIPTTIFKKMISACSSIIHFTFVYPSILYPCPPSACQQIANRDEHMTPPTTAPSYEAIDSVGQIMIQPSGNIMGSPITIV